MARRFTVVPASYVVFLRNSASGREVLLQLRAGTRYMDGYWATAVAGHIEAGETAFEAAHREAAEEVGVRDVALEPLCAMHRTVAGEGPWGDRVDYFFTTTSWFGDARIMEPDKCAQLRWFPLDALPEPVVPHERQVLEALRAGRVPPIIVHGF